jgi:hypothetical protein
MWVVAEVFHGGGGFSCCVVRRDLAKDRPCFVVFFLNWQWPVSFGAADQTWCRQVAWGRRRHLCTILLFEASLLKKLYFWCCLGGVSTTAEMNSLL